MSAMPEPKEVTIEVKRYLCPICERQVESRALALEHCACAKCGIPRDISKSNRGLCEGCQATADVANAKATVKRREKDLEETKFWMTKRVADSEHALEEARRELADALQARELVRASKKGAA